MIEYIKSKFEQIKSYVIDRWNAVVRRFSDYADSILAEDIVSELNKLGISFSAERSEAGIIQSIDIDMPVALAPTA